MSKVDRFVQHAIDIAKDDSHGYSQYRRWGQDYDCSSLMYECGYYAGYNLPMSGTRYTGSMVEHFKKAGYHVEKFNGNLADLERGDVLLNVSHHTAVYIGDGKLVEASIAETGGIDGRPGDQTGHEIHVRNVYNYPWTHVLTPPKEVQDWLPVGIWTLDRGIKQRWKPVHGEDGYITLINASNGMALDVSGASAKDGTRIQAYKPNGTAAQKWALIKPEDKYKPALVAPVELVPAFAIESRLDIAGGADKDGSAATLYKANGSNAQKFTVIDSGAGYWYIVNVGSCKALTIL